MQASLSPKKYIETRVRNLPIYKCLVNTDWEISSMANVIVMRQHVNGHVSGGVYLVDLFCLGVKESIWFFNEDEAEMMERFKGAGTTELKTIDYELAHNIVYAGHDFALGYDIHPHPDFKTSRFVLEEDDDQIALVDIQTGYGDNGIPHLMANQAGQYAEALGKLKKNAGEGNYLYTIAFDDADEEDYNEENEEDDLEEGDVDEFPDIPDFKEEGTRPLSDFPDGELTLQNVQEVLSTDLADEDKVAARNTLDKMICLTEMMLRILPSNFYDEELEWAEVEWDELEKSIDLPNGITEAELEEWKKIIEKSNALDEGENDEIATIQQLSENMESHYAHNPFVAAMLVADAIFADNGSAKHLLTKWQSQHGQLPLFQLLCTFYGVLKNEPTDAIKSIVDNNNIAGAFPKAENFNELEFALFHALQCIKNCKAQNMHDAVQHYHLTAATDIVHILFMPMMDELLPLLQASALKQFPNITNEM